MDRTIAIIGNPITIFDKYVESLINKGYAKIDYDEKIHMHHTKILYTRENSVDYNTDKLCLAIIATDKIEYADFVFMDCDHVPVDKLQSYVESLIQLIKPDRETVFIIHPTANSIKITQNNTAKCSRIKCFPFEKLQSIIESYDIYSDYICLDERFKDIAENYIDNANNLSMFANSNPHITLCCMEDEITYPVFTKVKTSDAITNKIDAISIDSKFVQNGPWKNVSTVLYKGIASKHVCQFDYTGINTLIITGPYRCNGECKVDVPNIIFIDQWFDTITDFCKNNATVIRFNHECYVKNCDEIVKQAYAIMEKMRIKKNPKITTK